MSAVGVAVASGPNTLVGRPMERVEDLRFLRGRGRYVADVSRPGQLHAVILRNNIGHGILKSIDTSAARKLPGVHRVLTAEDFGNPVPLIPLRLQPLAELDHFHQPVIATGKVRYVGEPMAVVVAESAAIGEDALELISVEIDALPAVTDRETAQACPSVLFESHGTNVAITWHATKGDAENAFRTADYVRRETFRVQRHAAMFMEPRGFVAEWNAEAGKLTVWGAAKTPWHNRRVLAKQLGLDLEAVDLIEVDVGGGFGSRGEFYPEDFLIPATSRIVGRPVKWIEDRREHLMTANHARDVECEVEIACTRDGRFLGLRGQAWNDVGAYLRTNGSVGPRNVIHYMCGPYTFEHIDLKSSMLTTNKTPCGTYRGPGRYETDFIRERMIDLAAKDLGIDRVVLRRQNLVADSQMPYALPKIVPFDSHPELDSGDYHSIFDQCLDAFNWAERSKLSGTVVDGYYQGFAVGSFIEGGAAGPKEEVRLVLETNGSLSVYMGSSSVGQGLETIMGQIAADAMEMPYDNITIHHGSTAYVKDGYGAYHSRSTVMGGSALLLAAEKLKTKLRELASAHFGCRPENVTVEGDAAVFGSERRSLIDLLECPLEVEAEFFNSKYTWAYGTGAAQVGVDPQTGHVKLVDFLLVEDVGRMINPLTLHGQALGSIVQGMGGAFLEHLVYDSEGQLLTGSFADYLMPTTSDFPNINAITVELKACPNNPLGAKGAGEGGLIPVGGLMANAVADALAKFGVEPMQLPLSPPRIWQLVQDSKAASAA